MRANAAAVCSQSARCPAMPKSPRISIRIFSLRGHRVILDADLALLYGVQTRAFNQAVKRNRDRFPADFALQLTADEAANLRSQFATSSSGKRNSSQIVMSSTQATEIQGVKHGWSQIPISPKAKHRGATYRPWAFTEHGALMAANILRSDRAVEMSVYVVRAFVKQRETLATNAAILKRLAEIDKTLLEHDAALKILWHHLQPLLAPPPETPKPKIGFHEGNR